MKHLKDGVECKVLQPILLDALIRLALLYYQYELELVVTALTDGNHLPASLHYRGYAADLRTRDIPSWQLPHLLDAIQHELGLAWDVVQEKDHFHLEFDPNHDGGKGLP